MRLLEYRNNPVNLESKLSGFLISNDPVRVFLYPDFMAVEMNSEFMWLISKSQALGCLCLREWLKGTELTACANWFMLVG